MNPYEAPKARLPASTIDRRFCRNLLYIRDRSFTVRLYFSFQVRRYVGLAICVAFPLLASAIIQFLPVPCLVLGIFLGVLLRDVAIVRQQQATWPTQLKVFDWVKVERMAAGESVE